MPSPVDAVSRSVAHVRAHPVGVDGQPVERPRPATAAPPVAASAVVSARHSLCQAPAARSCSCTIASSRTRDVRARRAGRTRARAPRPTGLCLCGIADDPPRLAASATSPTSVCASSDDVGAIFADRAGGARRAHRRARRPAARTCATARAGSSRSSSAAKRGSTSSPVVAEGRQRARRAAELRRQAARDARRAAPRLDDARQPARRLEPERRRHGLLEQRAAGHQRPAVLVGQCRRTRRPPPRAPRSIGTSAPARRASRRCRATSWLVAPRWTYRRVLADRPRSARTSGSTGLPAGAPRSASSRRRRDRRARVRRSPAAAAGGTSPRATPPRRVRRSTSSIASSHAPSETASATRPGRRSRAKSVRCVKKTVCALALQEDVEAQWPSSAGDQRRRAGGSPSERQHRVAGVGLSSSAK